LAEDLVHRWLKPVLSGQPGWVPSPPASMTIFTKMARPGGLLAAQSSIATEEVTGKATGRLRFQSGLCRSFSLCRPRIIWQPPARATHSLPYRPPWLGSDGRFSEPSVSFQLFRTARACASPRRLLGRRRRLGFLRPERLCALSELSVRTLPYRGL